MESIFDKKKNTKKNPHKHTEKQERKPTVEQNHEEPLTDRSAEGSAERAHRSPRRAHKSGLQRVGTRREHPTLRHGERWGRKGCRVGGLRGIFTTNKCLDTS